MKKFFGPLLNPRVSGGILIGSIILSLILTFLQVKFKPTTVMDSQPVRVLELPRKQIVP